MFIIIATGIGFGLLYLTYKRIDKKRKEEATAKDKEKEGKKEELLK